MSPFGPTLRTPRLLEGQVLDRLGLPIVMLVAVGVSLRPGLEHDAWWHMASGRWMVIEGAWLREDVFSWTRLGEPWVRPGLVADVGMYLLHDIFGPAGLTVTTSVLFVSAFVMLWPRLQGSAVWRTTVMVLCLLTAVVAAVPRPLVATLPLTAATIVVLDRERSAPTPWLWTLPLLAVLWVNLHGAFVVLFVLLSCHAVARLWDAWRTQGAERRTALGAVARLVTVGVVSVVSTLANPFGWRMLPYPIETLQLPVLGEFVHEWRQPTPLDSQFWPLFGLLGVIVVVLVRGRARVRSDDLLLTVAFGSLALTAARHAAVLAVVVPPLLTRLASGGDAIPPRASWRSASRGERRVEAGLLVALAVGVAAVTAPALTNAGNDRATRQLIAVDAIDWAIAADLPPRVWNSYDQGGYLIWAGWPEVRVSIDSRTDLFGDAAVRRHVDQWLGRGDPVAAFEGAGIRTVVVESHAPLVALLEDAGWERVFEDGIASVMTVSGSA